MVKKDLLVLPQNWGRIEIDWPFSKTARHIDIQLKKAGYHLTGKSFLETPTRSLRIARHYEHSAKTYVETFSYSHEVRLPARCGISGGLMESSYRDFSSKDVTWHVDDALLPLSVLSDSLSDHTLGRERFIATRPFLMLTVETNRGPPPATIVNGHMSRRAAIHFAQTHGLPPPTRAAKKNVAKDLHSVNVADEYIYSWPKIRRFLSDIIFYRQS